MSSNLITSWTTLNGSSLDNQSNDLVIGSDGSIYITGTTRGNLNGQSNSGLDDAFVSKFNNDGELQWTRLLGTAKGDLGESIAIGSDGSLYVVGYTNGDLDGETNASSSWSDTLNDAFISKFNSDGSKKWTKLFGINGTKHRGIGIDIGDDESIYITGNTLNDLGGETNNGGYDAFVSKLNSDGIKQWSKLLGSSESEFGEDISIGSDGSLYVVGYTNGDLDGETNNGQQDAFISKFNSNGDKQWTKLLGTSGGDEGKVITISSDGSIFIAGNTEGDLDGQTNNGGFNDAFISKFNSGGTKEWTRLLGTSYEDYGNALTTGTDGSIYISGFVLTDLNGEENNGSWDAFICKYNSEGEIQLTKLIGSSSDDRGRGITIDNNDYIYLTGQTEGDLNGQSNNGSKDVFLVKLIGAYTPTDISLSSTSFNENIDAASTVASLSTTDADSSDSHTYMLVSGTGDTDNASFTIEGSNLKISSSPDYETKSSYLVRLKTTDSGGLTYEEAVTFNVNDLIDTGLSIASVNDSYSADSKGFASISGSAPVTVTSYEIGQETTLDSIKDYDGNLHAGDTLDATASSYKYQGLLDVNGDGVFETIFTNKVSRRWVTAKVDSITGQIDFSDHGAGGGTRVVGIYADPLISEGESNGGFLSDGVTPAPAAIGATGSDRYVDLNGDGDFDDDNEDRLALNSQVRFQNDLEIDNLSAKHSGDYDGDGIHEVYWKTNDGTAYLRSLMHADGNIRYANYQSEEQMSEYLTAQGHTEIISDIV